MHAATSITWPTKAVWDEIRLLDQGNGCWATCKVLGARLALAPRTIESAREWLKAHELLAKTLEGKFHYWSCRLPSDCYPEGLRPSDVQVFALAARLDQHITKREQQGLTEAPPARPRTEPRTRRHRGLEPVSEVLKCHPAFTRTPPLTSGPDPR